MPNAKPEKAIADKILQAAVRLFAQKGYAASSTREIVEAAGVTKPMLYYYYESKEGVARAAFAHFLDPFHARLTALIDTTMPARERLVEVVWQHFDFCRANPEFARLFYALFFGPDEQSTELDAFRYSLRGNELVAAAVARLVTDGTVEPARAESLTMALHGLITIRIMAAIKGGLSLDREAARAIIDDLLTGFAATAPKTKRNKS